MEGSPIQASLALLALTFGGSVTNAGSEPQAAAAVRAPSAFIDDTCIVCHDDTLRTGGLSLSEKDPKDVGRDAALWEKVLHKLDTGQMPPAGIPRDEAALTTFRSRLEDALDRRAAAEPNPGRVGVHRLNRTEYENVVRDLLGLEIDSRSLLLPDEADDGFDNVAVSLALSPAHLERYLAAARIVSRLAVGDRTQGEAPGSATYKVPKLLEQDVRVAEEMPFGSRGGVGVRHTFPADGEYRFKVRLRRQVYDYIIGMGEEQQLDLRIDGRRIERLTVGGQGVGTPGPLTWNGEIVGETEWELYMHAADDRLELSTDVTAGPHLVSVSFVDSPWEPEGATQPLQVDFGRGADEHYDGYAAVDALSIHGPYEPSGPGDTPSRRTIFVCTPQSTADERPCAKKILTKLARRAYRRPVDNSEVETLLDFYEAGRTGRGFDAGIQSALERLLVSFNFLFRIEQDPTTAAPGEVYRLSDVELASRLSFFLWSSIPDEELLDIAIRGRLQDRPVLEQQVRRMLRDERARALVDNFAGQWLGVRKASAWLPDPNMFPEFDENLRQAFIQETRLFVENQLREDRSIVDLVSAEYSFLNERLAQHYEVPGVHGERFRKVEFDNDVRGGILGQGSILMVTSYPDRTAPVLRGLWALDSLLGMPPPPPPPDVPDLIPKAAGGRVLSMRERMEVHRENPACAVCHVRMDPIGFSLENFDAIGRYRTSSDGVPVDASAVFADGSPLEGVRGLRDFVVERRSNYVHTFVEKMLTYALGRHISHDDQPSIRAIVRDAADEDYSWSSVILGIANSTPFQMRRTAS